MSVGEARGKTLVKLMEALVESALSCESVYLGVGRLHPKTSLQIEIALLPLKWEAKKRCIEFSH